MELDNDLLNEFVFEAKTHIEEMVAGLLRMEAGEGDDDIINEIFRAAHSIKGTASFFELNNVVEVSHSIENLFGKIREHQINVSSEMIDALLLAVDVLKELISSPGSSKTHDITGCLNSINFFLDVPQHQLTQTTNRSRELSAWDLWNQLTTVEEQKSEAVATASGELSKNVTVQTAAETDRAAVPVVQQQAAVKPREVVMEDSVRVNVDLLNDLLNLAGEMVLRRNQLLRIAQDEGRQVPQLEGVAKSIDELTTNLQKKIMKTRMQPIANVFNKFPRIVRDLSRKIGKEVDLDMQGMDVELDRSLIEALVDPMTHLVRNALDHGIELPKVRQMSNKSVVGSLVLHAYHESERVIIDVCDDGAGINPEKVKAKAVQKGLISEKEIAAMRDVDIMQFIMTPGFSTAEQITAISGRGVGMDVVKTNIEKIGGKIEIFSDIGTGTTFRLILPLTLAIISSLIVMAEGKTFAIPQANVRELLLILPGEISGKRVEMVHNRPVLRLRENLLPLVGLGQILSTESLKPAARFDSNQILRVLVIKAGNMAFGLVVDAVYDTEEILVKPISTVLGNCGLYSGVTVLGDGSIAMILDTESIRHRAGISFEENQPLQTKLRATNNDEDQQYLLLFKCSGGEMLGLDLAMVSRVEEMEVSRLQKIGSKYYFSFQGQTIRVIRPEHYLPISRRKNKCSKIYVILPKLVKHSIGIVAEEIHDAIYAKVVLDKDGVCGTGLLGSALINDQVVTLLNMHELFAKAAPEYYRHSAERKKTGEEYSDGEYKDKRQTILLVEDTPVFLKVIKSYLESDGYDVITAENGREALERLKQTKIDMVVSDIEMPIMTGMELVRAIRASEDLRQLPVIALTSITGEANKEKGLRAGFDIYEYKLDRTGLLEDIRNVLQKRAQPKQKG